MKRVPILRRPSHIPVSPLMVALMAGLLLPACGDDPTPAPSPSGPRVTLKVITRNLYLGSELTSIVLTPSADRIPTQAAMFVDTVKASDPPGRMRLVAQEIAEAMPDLVGLQEVERYRTQTPSNFNLDAPAPPDAEQDLFDFLALLQAALMERGLRYVAFENVLSDAELPMALPDGSLMDVRLTDRDVILVREGLSHTAGTKLVFQNHLPLTVGGKVPVKFVRGYHAVAVVHEGVAFTFVNSHLEIGGPAAAAQEGQARELVAALEALPGTLIVAGDFNSSADGRGTTSYGQLTRILTDGWLRATSNAPGPTCCSDLDAATFMAGSRIDLVLHRGTVQAESAQIIGTDAARRTSGGLFASDHAGVLMTLSLPKPE